MIRKIKELFEKRPILREIFLYGLIGGTSAGLDFILTIVLTHIGVNALIANVIGVVSGITLSFFLNTFYNFRQTDKLLQRALKFYGVGILGMLLSNVILVLGGIWFGYKQAVEFFGITLIEAPVSVPEGLDINFIAVKFVSVFIVAAFQYVLNKFITYRKKEN